MKLLYCLESRLIKGLICIVRIRAVICVRLKTKDVDNRKCFIESSGSHFQTIVIQKQQLSFNCF